MRKKFKFHEGIGERISVIPKSFTKDYIGPKAWEDVVYGGHGELLEIVSKDYLISMYHNIETNKNRSDVYDLKVSKTPYDVLIDIRRTSNKNHVFLGHTSGGKSSETHQSKISKMKDGGFVVVRPFGNFEICLNYISAKWLLNNSNVTKKMCIRRLEDYNYKLDFALTN